MEWMRLGKSLWLYMFVIINTLLPMTYQVKANETTYAPSLAEALQLVLEDERLAGAISGVSVRENKMGKEIFSHQSELRLRPASNMKLITGVAALEILGEDYRFHTTLSTDGEQKGNTLHGNLYLKGKGDPTLSENDLHQFARDLKELGIEKINGHLIADDSWYDDVRLSTDLNWNDESNHTGAQVSALTLSPNQAYHTGTIQIEVKPGQTQIAGDSALISVSPQTDYITVNNHTKLTTKEAPPSLTVEREHGTNEITVTGNIALDAKPLKSTIAVWEPTEYVLAIFKQKLTEQGVILSGLPQKGSTPNQAKLLLEQQSPPLKDILIPFMKLSNNGIGEMLTKELGKKVFDEGSWEKGLIAMENQLQALGLNTETILLRDGSGLSHKTMIPATELTKMLYFVQEKEWFPVFKTSLPLAGEADELTGGTLRYRLTDLPTSGQVYAKTGTLNGVSTLSGYVRTLRGVELSFSIMINNHLSDTIHEIEDQIVNILISN